MSQLLRVPVISKNGIRGDVLTKSRLLDDRPEKPVTLETGREISVPARHLHLRTDGSYFLDLNVDPRPPDSVRELGNDIVIPRIEEHAEISKRSVETGRVVVQKTAADHEITIDEPLIREQYDIRRVTLNQVVEEALPARVEGDVTIIPVYDEETVVTKRLILREELHLVKKRFMESSPQTISLRKEAVTVERIRHETPRPLTD